MLWPAIGTRPEVQLTTNLHARYTNYPLRGDMVTLDKVLDYLVNSPELGLVLGGHVGGKLYATVDASYGRTRAKSHTPDAPCTYEPDQEHSYVGAIRRRGQQNHLVCKEVDGRKSYYLN